MGLSKVSFNPYVAKIVADVFNAALKTHPKVSNRASLEALMFFSLR